MKHLLTGKVYLYFWGLEHFGNGFCLKEQIWSEENREDHRFTSNLHGLMMMIVEIFLPEMSY